MPTSSRPGPVPVDPELAPDLDPDLGLLSDDELRELLGAFHDDDPLTCECMHGAGEEPCGRPAAFAASILCAVEDCDGCVEVHLACADCACRWLESAGRSGVRMRMLPL